MKKMTVYHSVYIPGEKIANRIVCNKKTLKMEFIFLQRAY